MALHDTAGVFVDGRYRVQVRAQVADVFTDMIERSVPGYRSIITMIETLTEHYAQSGSKLYDLGCSLGASTLSMRRGITADGCSIISVDNSEAMIKRCFMPWE